MKKVNEHQVITVVGNVIVYGTVVTLLVLFFTQGNGRWIANFIINS